MRMATTTAKSLLHDPVSVTVRFEEDLLRQLEESAKRSLRSRNAEINHQLRSSLERKADESSAA
jgi:metal-responsive CopG/Arc/MetJ family transcriptional regulator